MYVLMNDNIYFYRYTDDDIIGFYQQNSNKNIGFFKYPSNLVLTKNVVFDFICCNFIRERRDDGNKLRALSRVYRERCEFCEKQRNGTLLSKLAS